MTPRPIGGSRSTHATSARLWLAVVACLALLPLRASATIIGGPVSYGGHDYLLLESSSWTDAEAEATALGGHLVTIDDYLEQEFVERVFANFGDVPRALWIGLSDTAAEGTFTWADGTPLGYTNWDPGEPNNFGNEDHVLIVPFGLSDPLLEPGKWSDWTNAATIETVPIYGVVEMPSPVIHEIRGKTYQLKDPVPDIAPEYRSVLVQGEALGGGHEIVGDPVAHGATLLLVANGATPSMQTFTLPPGLPVDGGAGWKPLGSPPFGYLYRDAKGAVGPIQQILLKRPSSGKFQIKVKLKGSNGPGPQPHILVHPPGPGTDGGMRLTLINGDSYCLAFGGAAGGAVSNSPATGGPGRQFKISGNTRTPLFVAGCPSPPTTTTSVTTSTSTSTTSSSSTTSTSTSSSTSTSTSSSTSTTASTSTSSSVTSSTSTTSTSTSTTTTTSTLATGCFRDVIDAGTIHDVCNDLQWEKKTSAPGLRNVDNRYSWAGCCNGSCGSTADLCQPNPAAAATCAAESDGDPIGCDVCSSGTCVVDALSAGAITTVWDWLNQLNASNFAGHADWRLPSEGDRNTPSTGTNELETLLLQAFPCGTSPCINAAAFTPTAAVSHWSASTASTPGNAWQVSFADGSVAQADERNARAVRAVRSSVFPPHPGDLDPSFGPGGTVTTALPGIAAARDVVEQPDGTLVVAGYSGGLANYDVTLVRYESNGALDGSFGTGGVASAPVGPADDFAHALIRQSDGRLVVAGAARDAANLEADFALVRFEATGTLDGSFGTGGKVTTAFGVGSGMSDVAVALLQQADGKLVAAGSAFNAPSFSGGDSDVALARYDSAGVLDPSFGTGGRLVSPFAVGTGNNDGATAVLQQADLKLVIAGYAAQGDAAQFALARFDASGVLDPTFGSGGRLTTVIGDQARANTMIKLASGKLLVAGEADEAVALARYEANGALDTTFGVGGSVRTAVGPASSAVAVVEQPDGKLVVGGITTVGPNADPILIRYAANGAIDPGFGEDGVMITVHPESLSTGSLIQQMDGALFLVAALSPPGDGHFFAARYQD